MLSKNARLSGLAEKSHYQMDKIKQTYFVCLTMMLLILGHKVYIKNSFKPKNLILYNVRLGHKEQVLVVRGVWRSTKSDKTEWTDYTGQQLCF